jgi:hypothetical protein
MDVGGLQGLMTAVAALIAAGVGVWNAFQAVWNKQKLEAVQKAMRRYGAPRARRRTKTKAKARRRR